jgi:hypothetical protein
MPGHYLRKASAVVLILAAAVGAQTVWDGAQDTAWFSGSGGKEQSYTITTAAQLAGLAKIVNGGKSMSGVTITLGDYIALNVTENWRSWETAPDSVVPDGVREWTAIGAPGKPFEGVFDGGLFVVRGIYINKSGETDSAAYQGLFGVVSGGGVIKRARVAESYIKGYKNVGGLVGSDSGGAVTDCYAAATVVGTGDNVGGLVGLYKNGTIKNSYSTGRVRGVNRVGGLVGSGIADTVEGSYATGGVFGTDAVGGLIGRDSGFAVTNVYAAGDVAGVGDSVGGLAGISYSDIANSYAVGRVSGANRVGGLVGEKSGASIKGCYAAGRVAGAGAGGVVGGKSGDVVLLYNYYNRNAAASAGFGIPKDEAEMESAEFVRVLNLSAYAMSAKKWVPTEKYPTLMGDQFATLDFAANFSGGSGKESNPHIIDTLRHLEDIAILVNCGADLSGRAFRLANDIYINEDTSGWTGWKYSPPSAVREWTSIGWRGARFNGTIDGYGFTVGGVYIRKNAIPTGAEGCVGLFGWIGKGGVVKNLGVAKSYISGYGYVGALAGWNEGKIKRCFTSANVEATGGDWGGSGIGGLVGVNRGDSITSSYAVGKVSGTVDVAGGLIGWNSAKGRVEYCYASGKVEVVGDDVGGLVGRNDSGAVIRNCYACGEVSGGACDVTGGLVGVNVDAAISKSYAVGKVIPGRSSFGGLVGFQQGSGKVDSSYYKIDVSIPENGHGAPRRGKEMRLRSNYKGWDFAKVWDIDVNEDEDDDIDDDSADTGIYRYPYLFLVNNPNAIVVSVSSPDRVVPNVGFGNDGSVVIIPPPKLRSEIKVGPNPVLIRDDVVNIFIDKNKIARVDLRIYDVLGNVINKMIIADKNITWNLTNAKGHKVSAGTYLIKGVIVGIDGKRERLKAVVGVK